MAFVFLAPLILLTALAVRLFLGKPVLFSQQRVGLNGVPFRFYKFRTLALDALARSEDEWAVAPPNRLAAFLRTTGLDELPQLLNVLRGEMSLVGPRPERPHFVRLFQKELPGYARRHDSPVGITGWAQVNGWRGDTSIAQRLEYDLHYLDRRSLALDLKILAMTVTGFARSVWAFDREPDRTRHAGVV